MGEKQRLWESQDPHYTLCLYTSPWMVSYQPHVEDVYKEKWNPTHQGSWWLEQWACWEWFLGFWTRNREFRFNRAVRSPSGSTSPQHSPSQRSCTARLPWKGCWKTRWHVRNAELKPSKGDSHKNWTLIKRWPGGERRPSHLSAVHPEGWRPGWRACLGNQQLLHCSPRKLLTCMFVGNCTSYFWSWDPV